MFTLHQLLLHMWHLLPQLLLLILPQLLLNLLLQLLPPPMPQLLQLHMPQLLLPTVPQFILPQQHPPLIMNLLSTNKPHIQNQLLLEQELSHSHNSKLNCLTDKYINQD